MTERTKDDQNFTGQDKEPFGKDRQQQPAGQTGETLTETPAGEQTGGTEGGFVAGKKQEEGGDYLQERSENEESDIEGSSKNFGNNGE